VGSDTYQGFGGLALLACVLLFSRKGEMRELKVILCVLGVFFLLPAVGSFFNGLNYATNRWAWAFALCVALVVCRMTDLLAHPREGDGRLLAIAVAVYGLLLLVPAVRTEANVAGFAALVAALALVVAASRSRRPRVLVGCALAITLAVNGFYFLSSAEGGVGAGQVPLGMGYAKLTTDSADSVALEAADGSWWRYDAGLAAPGSGAPVARIRNNSLVLALEAPDFYNSVYNDNVDAFHTELAVAGDDINFSYVSLQGRSDVMSLLGVRYYVQRADGTDPAPYGFDEASPVAEKSVMATPTASSGATRRCPSRSHSTAPSRATTTWPSPPSAVSRRSCRPSCSTTRARPASAEQPARPQASSPSRTPSPHARSSPRRTRP
jgi:hypothetical protein